MLCYKDRTYCSASRNSCFNRACSRFFSEQDGVGADLWWKGFKNSDPTPVAFGPYHVNCEDIVPEDDTRTEETS